MVTNNDQKLETILRLSKRGTNFGEFHGNLEDFIKFAIEQGIEAQLDGMHVAREVKYTAQRTQEDTKQ